MQDIYNFLLLISYLYSVSSADYITNQVMETIVKS